MNRPHSSRRQFLRESFAFSAAAFLGSGGSAHSATESSDSGSGHHLLTVGDWGAEKDLTLQKEVAASMRKLVQERRIKTEALLMLGDNFYGQFDGLENSPRWKSQFEDMYPRTDFDCPCYAVLGNHDYNFEPKGKTEAQLAYARKSGTRWIMPSKWYRFEFPAQNPLVTFIALDTNYQTPSKSKGALSEAERSAQNAWLKEELSKPRTTPYLIVLGHHPVYSNGPHGDTKALAMWVPLFREHNVHFYFCGHDHDMQHLEFDGYPTSFVVSGGGGATLTPIIIPQQVRGPCAKASGGFSHLEITKEKLLVRLLDKNGGELHAFSKTPDGKVSLKV